MKIKNNKYMSLAALFLLFPNAQAGQTTEEHHHDSHAHDIVEATLPAPSVRINVTPDSMQGWNLHLITDHFVFAPQNVGNMNRPGEGHAHLYVDGRKLGRLYGEWFHIQALEPGKHEIRVSLNSNDHRTYAYQGIPIESKTFIEVK